MKRFLVILLLLIFCMTIQAATISYPDASLSNPSRWGIAKFRFDSTDINTVSCTTNYPIYGKLDRITIDANGTESDWTVALTDSLGITLFSKTDCNSTLEPYGYAITQPDGSGSTCYYREVAVFGPLTCTISDVNHSTEVQTLTLNANATGGEFHLIYGDETTAAINYTATNAEIQTALTNLSLIGSGGVAVTGTGNFNERLNTVFTFKTVAGDVPILGITSTLTPTTTTTFTETTKGGNNLNPIDVIVYYFKNGD